MTLALLTIWQNALDCRNVERTRHIVNNRIQQFLDTLILITCTTKNRVHTQRKNALTDTFLNLCFCKFFASEEFLEQFIVHFCDMLNKLGTIFLCLIKVFSRNVSNCHILTLIIVVNSCLHCYQIDNTLKFISVSDWQLNWDSVSVQTVFHHLNNSEKVSTVHIHLIYISDTRNAVFVRLLPYSFTLRLYTTTSTENRNRTVQNLQTTLNLDSEVYVSRCVDNVNLVAFPICCSSSTGDSNTTLTLLNHPVHSSLTLVHLT